MKLEFMTLDLYFTDKLLQKSYKIRVPSDVIDALLLDPRIFKQAEHCEFDFKEEIRKKERKLCVKPAGTMAHA